MLGSDPRETALDTAERASRAVAEALPRNAKVHLSYGDEDLEEYVFQLAADHLIHGWDLAVATDGDAVLDHDLVAGVAAWFAAREDVYRSAGAIGARAAAADDAQSQLLAAFGRNPLWAGRTD